MTCHLKLYDINFQNYYLGFNITKDTKSFSI